MTGCVGMCILLAIPVVLCEAHAGGLVPNARTACQSHACMHALSCPPESLAKNSSRD